MCLLFVGTDTEIQCLRSCPVGGVTLALTCVVCSQTSFFTVFVCVRKCRKRGCAGKYNTFFLQKYPCHVNTICGKKQYFNHAVYFNILTITL